MSWPDVFKIGNVKDDPDSQLLGGDDDAPLNRAPTALEQRTDNLMDRLMCEIWTSRTAGSSYTGTFNGVCWSETLALFCAVGATGEIQTSPEGIKWTHRTAGSSYTGAFNGVCWSETLALFCAVGATGEIQTSPDGVTWTHRTAGSSYTGAFNGVCWSDTRVLFCAVGATGEIQTSPDGVTWTHRTAGSSYTGAFQAVISLGSKIFAVGATGEIQTSGNEVTWSRRAPAASGQFNRVVGHQGTLFAVGASGLCWWTTDDGESWSVFSLGTSANLSAAVVDPVRRHFFVGGAGGEMMTISFAGLSVELRGIYGSQLNSMCEGNGLLLAVGATGKIQTSIRL